MRGEQREIGAKHVGPGGYTVIKTPQGWRLLHHVIAEQEYGRPIDTATERVIFVDGNRTNFAVANIRIVKKKHTALEDKRDALEADIARLQAELDRVTAALVGDGNDASSS